jgi:uncharacterized protein
MAKKVFIGATGQNCGKTTLSVSLMHLARKTYGNVGFVKPIGPKVDYHETLLVDMDALLIAKTYELEDDIAFMSPVALHKNFTREYLARKISTAAMEETILTAVEELEKRHDFLIIEGAGHCGVGSVIGLSNARVAHLLDAPVLMVTESGIGRAIDAVHLNLALYRQEKADVRAIIMNKLIAEKRAHVLDYLNCAFSGEGIPVLGGFNYSPILANPTLGHISKLLNLPLQGDPAARRRIIHTIQLGAASSQRVVDALQNDTVVVVTSSRDELIVTLSSLYLIPAYRDKIAGLVIAGHVAVSQISQQILDESGIPYIRISETTSEVFTTITDDVSKITAEDREKLNWIRSHAELNIDFAAIDGILS